MPSANKTPNYNLTQYSNNGSDKISALKDYNEDMSKIDVALNANANTIANKADTATTYSKTDIDGEITKINTAIQGNSNTIETLVNNKTFVSVSAYGAKGDGVTDDTEAFTTAVGVSSANNKALFVPAGRYVLSQTINLSNITLFGVYNASVLVKPSGEIFHIGSNVAVNNLVFEGNEGAQVEVNDWVNEAKFAITSEATVSNVTVDHCIASVGKLVRIGSIHPAGQSSNIQITNNQVFKWEGKHGPSATGAIVIIYAKHILIANNLIDNADIADCGIVLWGGDADNSKTSYDGVSYIDGAIIERNRIYHTGASSIFCSLASNLTISNNHCEDGGDFLIDPEGCRNTTIIGNYVRSGRATCASIYWSSTGKLSFIGNTFIHTNNGNVLTVVRHIKDNSDEIYIISNNMFVGEGDTLSKVEMGELCGRTLFDGNVLSNCRFSSGNFVGDNYKFTNNYLIYDGTKIPANQALAHFAGQKINDASSTINSNTFILKQQQEETSASVVLLDVNPYTNSTLRFTNNVIMSIVTNKVTILYSGDGTVIEDCLISGNNFDTDGTVKEFTDIFSLIDKSEGKTGLIKILYKENYVRYFSSSGENVLQFKSLPDAKFFKNGSVVRVSQTSTGDHYLINGAWMHAQLIAD
jgi:hypothetical protein